MKANDHKIPVWEWFVAGAGLLIILFVVGVFLLEGLFASRAPAMIELRVKETVPHGSGELVMIEVHNRGGQTASDLKVRGSLASSDSVLEFRELTIDYVPRHSRKVIGLFFSQPTQGRSLRLEPIGFVEP